jgi:histidyl-tRNA synthetase
MIDTIASVYKSWGYQPLSTPAIEMEKTLTAKAGDEIAGQLFKIEESEYALRFDLTVGTARFAANNSMPKPYKRYCIAPVWRREEPQKGRLREFLQADADIVGSPSMRCEAELIALACQSLEKLGFSGFKVLLNNRKILSGIVKTLGVEKKEGVVLRALDKLDKIGKEAVASELEKGGISKKMANELMNSVLERQETNETALEIAKKYSQEGANELEALLKLLRNDYGILNVYVEPSLVRGLGYYTGPIFEIKASDDIGSVAGGGRYDNLLGLYGQNDFAVGISLGIERLFAIRNQGADPTSQTDVMIVCLEEKYYAECVTLANRLRQAGINVETDLNERKMRGQLEYANACKILFAIIMGKKEVESGLYTLKNLNSGEQKELNLEQAIENILEKKEMK